MKIPNFVVAVILAICGVRAYSISNGIHRKVDQFPRPTLSGFSHNSIRAMARQEFQEEEHNAAPESEKPRTPNTSSEKPPEHLTPVSTPEPESEGPPAHEQPHTHPFNLQSLQHSSAAALDLTPEEEDAAKRGAAILIAVKLLLLGGLLVPFVVQLVCYPIGMYAIMRFDQATIQAYLDRHDAALAAGMARMLEQSLF